MCGKLPSGSAGSVPSGRFSAESVSGVPHHGGAMSAFALEGPYMRDTLGGAVDFRNLGIQLTRGGRALKLWLSVQVFGADAFRAAVAHGIALAEHAERVLREVPGWEVVTPAQLAIVCFRRDGDDALQTRIAQAMIADGFAAPSTTEVRGRVALRLCTINPRTTFEDVERTIALMDSCARG